MISDVHIIAWYSMYMYTLWLSHCHCEGCTSIVSCLKGSRFICVNTAVWTCSKGSQRTTSPISPSFSSPDGFGTRSRTWSPTWKLCQAVLTKFCVENSRWKTTNWKSNWEVGLRFSVNLSCSASVHWESQVTSHYIDVACGNITS